MMHIYPPTPNVFHSTCHKLLVGCCASCLSLFNPLTRPAFFFQLVAGIEPFGFQVENPVLGPTQKELEDAYQNASSVSFGC